MSLGSRIKEARNAKGWTMDKLRNKFVPPYSMEAICKWESDRTGMPITTFCHLCRVLEVTPNFLLQDELGDSDA